MTPSLLREVPIIDLTNELNLLFKDYSFIHDAPKCINETLTDLKYLSDTLNYLESLLGDSEHKLHMPEPAQVVCHPPPLHIRLIYDLFQSREFPRNKTGTKNRTQTSPQRSEKMA